MDHGQDIGSFSSRDDHNARGVAGREGHVGDGASAEVVLRGGWGEGHCGGEMEGEEWETFVML